MKIFIHTTKQIIRKFFQTTRQKLIIFKHDVDSDMFTRQGIGYWRIESTFEVQ